MSCIRLRPEHYVGDDGMETIDAIRCALTIFADTREQADMMFLGFVVGNQMKYQHRAGKKTEDPSVDLRKAEWYRRMGLHVMSTVEKFMLISDFQPPEDPRTSRDGWSPDPRVEAFLRSKFD